MLSTPKVTVIIPVYNVSAYLDRCVKSVLGQTYQNLEIFLVDDGSTDGCGLLCDQYERQDERIRVIHKQNGGLSSARNAALDVMTGEYVTFVDADDYIDPHYIQILTEDLVDGRADISVCDEQRFSDKENGTEEMISSFYQTAETNLRLTNIEGIENILYQRLFDASACGKMYRSVFFSDIRYPEGRIFEDIGTTYKLFLKAEFVSFHKDKLYFYFMRSGSLSHTLGSKQAQDGMAMAEQQYNDLCIAAPALRKAASCRMVSMYFHVLLTGENGSDAVQYAWNRIKEKRWTVILDRKARKKTWMASVLSLMGREVVQKAFLVKEKQKFIFKSENNA